jgi:autotransporter-associated beta strand protein
MMNLQVENTTLHTRLSKIFAPICSSTKTFMTLFLLVAVVAGWSSMSQATSYTNTATGNWDDSTKWNASGLGVSGADTIIVFKNAAIDYSTNNNAGAFILNKLQMAGGKAVYLNTSGGSSLLFTNSSVGTLPSLDNNCSQAIELFTPITIATNLTVSTIATGGGGHIKFNGGITGTGNITLLCNGKIITFNAAAPINNTGLIINSGAGSDSVTISGVISNNVTAVVQNSATSSLILSGVNTFSGGLYIKAGKVSLGNANAAGNETNTIYLGDAATDSNVTLSITVNSSSMKTNPISVVAGNTGTATLNFDHAATTGYVKGLITLNSHDLIVANTAGLTGRIEGGITGIGSLTFTNNALINVAAGTINTIGNITFSHTGTSGMQIYTTDSLNNTGTITNNSTSTGDVTITAPIGSNVTAIVQDSTTSTMKLSGANTAYSGTTTVSAGTLEIGTSNSLGTASSIIIAADAKMYLHFSGTNTVKSLMLGNTSKPKGVYNVTTDSAYFTAGGAGSLNVTTGPAVGTVIRLF